MVFLSVERIPHFGWSLLCIVWFLLAYADISGASLNDDVHHEQRSAQVKSALAVKSARKSDLSTSSLRSSHFSSLSASLSSSEPSARSLSVRPVDFGGDPSGLDDSTAALQSCIAFCSARAALSPNGYFPGWRSFGNGHAIGDAGGCFINLDGGEYLISQPLNIPEYVGNVVLGYGALIAAKNFTPADGFLVSVGANGDGCNVPQASCNVDISFPFLFVDGGHVASGLQFNHIMGGVVGPGSYFLNFTKFGVQINGGHEVEITHCWLGETNWDFDHVTEGVKPNATAVEINGNDHLMHDTVVFSAKVGVAVHGAANLLSGVHVWFPWNAALAFVDAGVMAFWITSSGNRFTGCYIDGGRCVIENGGSRQLVWENGFECCAPGQYSNVPHGIIIADDNVGPGLVISHNIFSGGDVWYTPSAASSAFASLAKLSLSDTANSITNTIITENSFGGLTGRGSRATLSLAQTNATKWAFDFSNLLIFPQIASVRATVVAQQGFTRWMVRPPVGMSVVVELEEAATAEVRVDADCSTY